MSAGAIAIMVFGLYLCCENVSGRVVPVLERVTEGLRTRKRRKEESPDGKIYRWKRKTKSLFVARFRI